jgi:geranylgeranyl pyrophosphate synthase
MVAQLFPQKSSLANQVKNIILKSMMEDDKPSLKLRMIADVTFGKMLRTNLAASILGNKPDGWTRGLEYVCAAVELMHTASLFHDDVIDGATLRRGKPTLWKLFSQNGAILLGDVMYCKALMMLTETEGCVHLQSFVKKAYEVCVAETEQELIKRGREVDAETCIKIARSKTGPFFAIIGRVCGYGNDALAAALEEVGYNIGTAYQLADDLIDEIGDDSVVGKTLGTDRLRKKFTVAHSRDGSARNVISTAFQKLCDKSLQLLEPWPDKQDGVRRYINDILLPSCTGVLQEDFLEAANGPARAVHSM